MWSAAGEGKPAGIVQLQTSSHSWLETIGTSALAEFVENDGARKEFSKLYKYTVLQSMCTNFTPTRNNSWVKVNFGIDLPGEEYPIEAYPGFVAPIVIQSHTSGRVASGLARFGLIPLWAKDDKISRHTYNARAETVSEKPSFRSSWRQRRYAIALVDNFFEPSYETGKAKRWKIELAAQDPLPKGPFGIASLWDTWTHPTTGELVTSFTMLTVNADAHPVMKQFHKVGDEKRTPVVLAPNQYAQWLSATPEEAMHMMSDQAMPELYSQVCPKN